MNLPVRYGQVRFSIPDRSLDMAALLLSLSALLPFHAVASDVEPLPRVRVDTSGSVARFRAGDSTKPLLPRGADYIRLNRTSIGVPAPVDPSDTPLPAYHSTFSVGKYNRTRAKIELTAMQRLGYNMARVFIDDGRTYCGLKELVGSKLVPVLECTEATSRPNGVGGAWNSSELSPEYMDNFADFVRLAAAQRVWLMPTFQRFPCTARFLAMTRPRNPDISDGNADYLDLPTVRAKAEYLSEFVRQLRARVGPALMSTVLAYSLENEARMYGNDKPFSDPSLTAVTISDGRSYNMSREEDRRDARDAGYAEWAHTIAAAIRAEDPEALVTAGMFTYYAVGHLSSADAPGPTKGDPRFPPDPAHLSRHSTLDYIDIHVYPAGKSFNLTLDLASENLDQIDRSRVPIMMGEFGTFKKNFPTVEEAAAEMQSLMLRTCKDYGFQGWLAWTWDTFEQEWMLWDLQDRDAYIGRSIAPINFTDPCFAGAE